MLSSFLDHYMYAHRRIHPSIHPSIPVSTHQPTDPPTSSSADLPGSVRAPTNGVTPWRNSDWRDDGEGGTHDQEPEDPEEPEATAREKLLRGPYGNAFNPENLSEVHGGHFPMAWFARTGDVPMLKYLHAHGARADVMRNLTTSSNAITLMVLASGGGHHGAMKWLYHHGAAQTVRRGDTYGQRPLLFACWYSHLVAAQWLISRGALAENPPPPVGEEQEEEEAGEGGGGGGGGDGGGGGYSLRVDKRLMRRDLRPPHADALRMGRHDIRPELRAWVTEVRAARMAWVSVVLPGMASRRASRCLWLVADLNEETATTLKQAIADFAGVEWRDKVMCRNVRELADAWDEDEYEMTRWH